MAVTRMLVPIQTPPICIECLVILSLSCKKHEKNCRICKKITKYDGWTPPLDLYRPST
ncbi:hypothetical protein CLOSTASPAR_04130 [[Clostridium] asparagiforme DSM 15981]|uniref:Uncharacterized protein n=1 Tax=[Clostridium] asparagiforme DSM 15981 TaxID=518636 RepID=C0D4D5_9FIRM|nr:hypothetical protein CLOSTASPAR_04130 [[Clostridium] asparagiforme DSM 15981]